MSATGEQTTTPTQGAVEISEPKQEPVNTFSIGEEVLVSQIDDQDLPLHGKVKAVCEGNEFEVFRMSHRRRLTSLN
jgi:hypothetical protein